MEMKFNILKAKEEDVDALELFFDKVVEDLESTFNYPAWKKDIYPTRETAKTGILEGNLFILRVNQEIGGVIALTHRDEKEYEEGEWLTDYSYDEIIVIHTLSVNPDFRKMGISKELMKFGESYARDKGMKSLRLDVAERNLPATSLYKSLGFQYCGGAYIDFQVGEILKYSFYEKPLL